MEYPEEIYQELEALELSHFESKVVKRLLGLACHAGFTRALENPDPPAGYSDLTAAISAGEPIDWERLDGLKVKCVRRGVGGLRGVLKRDDSSPIYTPDGWWKEDMDYLYAMALVYAWWGSDGWSLWLEGEIPLRRKTADQLEVGHFFTGVLSGTTSESLMCVAGGIRNGKHVRYAFDFMPSHHPASKWEVLEEHGTFQEPEGK